MIPSKHNLYKPNPGLEVNKSDRKTLEHGRERFSGFLIGKSSFPCFFSADGHKVHLEDSARGSSVIITLEHDAIVLQPEIINKLIIWNINNHQGIPNFLTIKSSISDLHKPLLLNPKIIKILPYELCKQTNHNPFCFYYMRNNFLNDNFLLEETINSTNEYAIFIKLAYVLGFRNIYVNGLITDVVLFLKYVQIAEEHGLNIKIISDDFIENTKEITISQEELLNESISKI